MRGDTPRSEQNRVAALQSVVEPLNALAAEVANRYGVLLAHLMSPDRHKTNAVTAARRVFVRLVRERFCVITERDGSRRCCSAAAGIGAPLSLPLLAEIAGYCNHSALVYSMR